MAGKESLLERFNKSIVVKTRLNPDNTITAFTSASIDELTVGTLNTTITATDTISEATTGAGVTIDGVKLKDGGALVITGGSNTFNVKNGTAELDIAAGASVNIDKSLTVNGSYGTVLASEGQQNTLTLNESLTLGDGYSGTLTFSAASKTLTVENTSAINQDVTSDGNPTFGNLTITSMAGNWTNAGRTVADGGIFTTIDINGGTVDGASVGAASPSTGSFTTLTATTTTLQGIAGMPYANLSNSTNLTVANTSTAYPVTFDTQDLISGVTHSTSTNPSYVTLPTAGTYLITFSAVGKTTTPNSSLDIWLTVDGSNVANSNTLSRFVGSGNERIITVTYIYKFTANQRFELMYRGDSTNVLMIATAAASSPTRPASPSIILTVNRIA